MRKFQMKTFKEYLLSEQKVLKTEINSVQYTVEVQSNGHKTVTFKDKNNDVLAYVTPAGRVNGGEIDGKQATFPKMDGYQDIINDVLEKLKLKYQ